MYSTHSGTMEARGDLSYARGEDHCEHKHRIDNIKYLDEHVTSILPGLDCPPPNLYTNTLYTHYTYSIHTYTCIHTILYTVHTHNTYSHIREHTQYNLLYMYVNRYAKRYIQNFLIE